MRVHQAVCWLLDRRPPLPPRWGTLSNGFKTSSVRRNRSRPLRLISFPPGKTKYKSPRQSDTVLFRYSLPSELFWASPQLELLTYSDLGAGSWHHSQRGSGRLNFLATVSWRLPRTPDLDQGLPGFLMTPGPWGWHHWAQVGRGRLGSRSPCLPRGLGVVEKITHWKDLIYLHTLWACSYFKVYFYLQGEMMYNKWTKQLQTSDHSTFRKKYINIL